MVNRNRRFALAAIALTFIFVAMPELARAATITVQSALDDTNPGHCTLREAINSANLASSGTGTCTAGSGTDTIEFSFVTAVTINLGSTLPAIANTLTITGPTTSPGITISGGMAVQLMVVNSGAKLTLQFLTMEDGGSPGYNGLGGAIYNSGTLTVANSTLSGNQAIAGNEDSLGAGGAIFTISTSTVTVTNSTFSANQATGPTDGSSGGAIYILTGTVSLKDSILADSTPNNCFSSVTASNSIADDGTCFTNGTNGNMVEPSTSAVGLDPAGLANNGGPTFTIALLTGSPAIDQIPFASCTYPAGSLNPCSTSSSLQLTCDQRGEPRPDPEDGPDGNCDIGAYEFQETKPSATATATATASPTATTTATASATPTATGTATRTATAT